MNLIKHFLQLETLLLQEENGRSHHGSLLGMIYHEAQTYFPFQNFTSLFILFIIQRLCLLVLLVFVLKCRVLSSELGEM